MSASPQHHIDDASVAVGDILGGRFRVTRLIGAGGMGTVVEAEVIDPSVTMPGQLDAPTSIAGRVAIKVLHLRYLDHAEAVARFQAEARAAVRIRSEHIAKLVDVGVAPNGAPFIVMELLEGWDLATLLRSGAVAVEEAVLYILQACVGMAYVHAGGLVHRDLKPGNLFVTFRPDGTPLLKVLDFGIAKSLTDEQHAAVQTMTLVAMGTPLYMSPEQVRSSRTVDGRADIWSLGAILYELLAGRAAFGGNTVANITAQVLEANPTPLPMVRRDIPPELDRIVRKALAKHPDGRFADVAHFAAALEPFAKTAGAGLTAHAAHALGVPVPSESEAFGAHGDDVPTAMTRRKAGSERWLKPLLGVLALLGLGIAYLVYDTLNTPAVVEAGPAKNEVKDTASTVQTATAQDDRAAAPPLTLAPDELPDVVRPPATAASPTGPAKPPVAPVPPAPPPPPSSDLDFLDERN